MSIWFEGSNEIMTSIDQVKVSYENLGEHYVGVVSLFPGLTSVDLIDQGSDFVLIRTNEGLMKRTSISKMVAANRLVVEFDEEYQTDRRLTVKSHYRQDFIDTGAGVTHRLTISDVSASGILGFFYRIFGKSSTGNATLRSYKSYLEISMLMAGCDGAQPIHSCCGYRVGTGCSRALQQQDAL